MILGRLSLATPERVPTFDVTGWVLRISASVLFLGVGVTKFNTDSYWVRLFAEIGFGDWFRYLTGGLQVASGLLFLIPRTVYAALTLAQIDRPHRSGRRTRRTGHPGVRRTHSAARIRPVGASVARLQAAPAAAVLPGRNRVRRKTA